MIQVRDLTKAYGATLAVDHCSFDVLPGRVTGFLGPNGSGKSTTMRLILGLDAADAGSATVNGRSYHDLGWPLHEVGALLEARAIHPGRSAYHHLRFLAQASGIPNARIDEVLDIVGLTSVARRRAGTFSLGMGQRLGIAAALLGDPEVLLFDEPVNGLDPDGIRWVRNLLKALAAEGRTVFVSSHLMSEMALTADHLVVIGRGRLIEQSSVVDFLAGSSRQSVKVVSPSAAELANVLRVAGATVTLDGPHRLDVAGRTAAEIGMLAHRAGIVLHELTPEAASLEDAFMERTGAELEFEAPERQQMTRE